MYPRTGCQLKHKAFTAILKESAVYCVYPVPEIFLDIMCAAILTANPWEEAVTNISFLQMRRHTERLTRLWEVNQLLHKKGQK